MTAAVPEAAYSLVVFLFFGEVLVAKKYLLSTQTG